MIDRMCPFLTFYYLVNIFHGIFLVQHRKGVVLVRFDISVTQILQTHARTDIDDIIFNTLGFLIGYILENLLQKILLKKQLGFGTEALILVMINGFLSIPFYEKTVSIGDMIFDSLSLNSWSGNSGYILSYNGIHYTMIPCIILAVISWAIAHRHPKDYGAKTAKIISIFMIVCFIGNFIQILSQDSIIPMLAASIVCAVISRKTIRY